MLISRILKYLLSIEREGSLLTKQNKTGKHLFLGKVEETDAVVRKNNTK